MSEQELDVPGECLVLRRFHLDSFCFSWGLECGICKKLVKSVIITEIWKGLFQCYLREELMLYNEKLPSVLFK